MLGVFIGEKVWFEYRNIFSNPVILHTHLPMKNGTECSETSAYKIQTAGNYPEESTQYSEHGVKFEIKNI